MARTYFYCDILEQLKHSDYMREYEVPEFKMPDEDGDSESDGAFEGNASYANDSADDASYQIKNGYFHVKIHLEISVFYMCSKDITVE